MRIGIDARFLKTPYCGLGNYHISLLRILEKIDSNNYYFLYGEGYPEEFAFQCTNPKWSMRLTKTRCYQRWVAWLMGKAGQHILDDKIDVLWSPYPLLPTHLPVKMAATVHDMVWKIYPHTMQFESRFLYRFLAPKALRRADYIFVVSQSTKRDLVRFFPDIESKIVDTPNAAGEAFTPQNKETSLQHIQNKFGFTGPYLLHVGTVEPRKNIIGALRIFKKLKDTFNIPHTLLIVGGKGWKNSSIYNEHKHLGLESSAFFAGFVPQEDMAVLYSGADVLLYTSMYEGFGFPVLEAMACGCPVVSSNVSSMPEVLGDAGVLVDTQDIEGFVREVHRLISDLQWREDRRQKGIARSTMFSWDKTARQILGSLNALESH